MTEDLIGKRALLIDLSAIFWPKWHGSAGAHIDAAYNYTIAEVKRLSKDFDIVAVCADSGRCFRYEVFPAYKGKRPPKDEAAVGQYERCCAELSDMGYHVLSALQLEADDVIATAVEWLLAQGVECVIAAADKDLFQLIRPAVSVKSVRSSAVLDVGNIEAKMGVRADQIVDLLSLAGDDADNIPGAAGIGIKRGAALLVQFGDIDTIYRDLDKIESEPTRKALTDAREQIDLNRTKLIPLITDAPIDCEVLRTKKEPVRHEVVSFGEVVEQPQKQAQEPAPRKAPVFIEKPSTVLAVAKSESWDMALEPANLPDAWLLAGHLAASRLIPSVATAEAALAVIMTGRELGIGAMAALRGIHIIEGKPSVSAMLLQALVQRSGKALFFDCVESTNTRAAYETHRQGSRKPFSLEYTIEDAARQKLVKAGGNWEKIPRTMLRWRVVAELARCVYPDVVMGIYIPSELGIEEDPTMLDEPTIRPRSNGTTILDGVLENPR